MLATEDFSAVPLERPGSRLLPYRPGATYSLFASSLALTDGEDLQTLFPPGIVERKGDLLVAVRAPFEAVGFTVSFYGALHFAALPPRYRHLLPGDEMLESRHVRIGSPLRWAFPWTTDGGDPAVLQLISSNYVVPRLVPRPGSFGGRVEVVYCNLLDPEEREAVAASGSLVRCVAPGRRSAAASSIQRRWRTCIADPTYAMCRRRLLGEFWGRSPYVNVEDETSEVRWSVASSSSRWPRCAS